MLVIRNNILKGILVHGWVGVEDTGLARKPRAAYV